MSWTDIANIILTVGQTAYQSRQQRKAQEENQRDNLIGRLTVEGQAPQLVSGAQMISDEPIMGSDVSQKLASLQYNPDAGFSQGGGSEAPEIPPELLAALMAEQEGPQFAATGGPVGKPDDTYYFTVEDIQGMMQEPDPMMQAVGAGLMGQMPPGGGMVPATPGQIQMMAEGGQPLYRDMGGQTNLMTTDPRDVGPDYDEIVMLESSDNGNELVEGVDYFMIDGEMLWPWELDARVQQEMDSGTFSSMISGLAMTGSMPRKPKKPKFGFGKRKKGSKPVFSAAQRYDMDKIIEAAIKSGRHITPTDRETLEKEFMEEVPIRRQEGGITAVKKFENFLTKSVGLNPKDVEWASSLSEKMYPGEGFDGRGDAARHLALGSLIPDAGSPNAAEFLSVAREYFPIPDQGREMDLHNNELGMQLTGSKEEIEEQIRELIDSNTAMYMELDESQKMRGY